ncbi:hypothetical protein FGO68_gene2174 [Halteria grandinella]|uniref:Uncharacterized protein n=1 Tax=Halteria grandinella TaxID=5974 RepID=A0A8J8NAE7_HALGN|nr:hypothetical protein FGO68_gene2174 [Halteria grandinella]
MPAFCTLVCKVLKNFSTSFVKRQYLSSQQKDCCSEILPRAISRRFRDALTISFGLLFITSAARSAIGLSLSG